MAEPLQRANRQTIRPLHKRTSISIIGYDCADWTISRRFVWTRSITSNHRFQLKEIFMQQVILNLQVADTYQTANTPDIYILLFIPSI